MFIISYKKDDSQILIKQDYQNNKSTVEDVTEIIKIQKRHFKKGEFFMQSISLEHLILEKKYTITELRVLFSLKNRIDFNNRIKGFRQTEIAKEINSSQANVSRAIKKLEKDYIIKKDGLDYYFNDKYIKFAGNEKNK